MAKLRKCEVCNRYTLLDVCPICNNKLQVFKTIKFSLEDPYLNYRIKHKKCLNEL